MHIDVFFTNYSVCRNASRVASRHLFFFTFFFPPGCATLGAGG